MSKLGDVCEQSIVIQMFHKLGLAVNPQPLGELFFEIFWKKKIFDAIGSYFKSVQSYMTEIDF